MQDERSLSDIENEVAEAFAKADSKDATPEDGQRLLALLKKRPGALGFTVDMAGAAIDVVIRKMQTSEANRALLHENLDHIRNSLGWQEASKTERLIIDQVVICHLRMNLTEQYYQNVMTEGCSLASASFWESKLSAVQRRYLRAIGVCLRHA